ncbi:hypothetical protein RSAG8_09321, partial [Rhizoctonia solani AG-8 WAC10335]
MRLCNTRGPRTSSAERMSSLLLKREVANVRATMRDFNPELIRSCNIVWHTDCICLYKRTRIRIEEYMVRLSGRGQIGWVSNEEIEDR